MSVGEALAEARVAAGLTVADVSERSLIREAVITAMEADDYEACGGGIFVNGYIRSIAAAIGTDPEPLIALYASSAAAAPRDPRLIPPVASEPAPGAMASPEPVFSDPVGATSAMPQFDESAGQGESGTAEEPAATAVQPVLDADTAAKLAATADESAWYDAFTYEESFVYEESAGEPEQPAAADSTAADLTTADMTAADLPVVQSDWPTSVDVTGEAGDPAGEGAGAGNAVAGETDELWESARGRGAAGSTEADGDSWVHGIGGASEAGGDNWAAAQRDGRPPGSERDRPSRPVRPVRPEPPRPERTRERRSLRWVAGLVVVLLLVVGLATGELISHTRHGAAPKSVDAASTHKVVQTAPTPPPTTPSPTPTPSPAPPPVKPPAVVALSVDGVWAYGTRGTANGDNPASARYAIRDAPPNAWRTSWYTTANFGGLKHGTGLLLDLGHEVTVTSLSVRSLFPGASLSLYLGNSTDRSDMRQAASTADAGTLVTWRLNGSERTRYVVIWCTRLPEDRAGTYMLGLYGVQVKGYTKS